MVEARAEVLKAERAHGEEGKFHWRLKVFLLLRANV